MEKIFIIAGVSDVETGGGNHLINLIRGLRRQGQAVTVVCMHTGTLLDTLQKEAVSVKQVLVKGKFDLGCVLRLRRLFQQEKPTIIHTHGERAMVMAHWAARSISHPLIFTTIHRSISHTDAWPKLFRMLYVSIEDLTLRYATTAAIAVSNFIRDILVRDRKQAPHKITTIYNGTQLLSPGGIEEMNQLGHRLRLELQLPDDAYVIGSVGRLVWQKGYQFLIQALPELLEQIPKATLVLVGDGPDHAQLQQLAYELGVSKRVKFVGYQANVYPWLTLFNLFVLASFNESFGLVIIEAMKFSTPVIATDSAGPAEIITDGHSGILIPSQNLETLTQAILALYKNPEKATRIGKAGFSLVEERFNADKNTQQTLDFYRSWIDMIAKNES